VEVCLDSLVGDFVSSQIKDLNGNWGVQMNNHMRFKFLTYSIPWLKEDIMIFFHEMY
jgi:hypothetical protein